VTANDMSNADRQTQTLNHCQLFARPTFWHRSLIYVLRRLGT